MSTINVDVYIAAQPAPVQPLLRQIRKVVRQAVPEAEEVIGYGIPSYRLNGRYLLHFGGSKNHIGLYATPDGHAEFESELAKYKRGKGSVQLPLDQPMPLDLIRRIAEFRVEQLSKGVK